MEPSIKLIRSREPQYQVNCTCFIINIKTCADVESQKHLSQPIRTLHTIQYTRSGYISAEKESTLLAVLYYTDVVNSRWLYCVTRAVLLKRTEFMIVPFQINPLHQLPDLFNRQFRSMFKWCTHLVRQNTSAQTHKMVTLHYWKI